MTLKPALSIILILMSLFITPSELSAATSPTIVIKTTVEEVISIMRAELLTNDDKWKLISKTINDKFDFRNMSQSLLENRWHEASAEEKRLCADYFSQYLEAVYRKQIESYTNQSVHYTKESINGENAIVNTYIATDTTDIPISYKMRLNNGKWVAYDIIINDVSLMDSHRNVLSTIIQSEGIEGLLRELQSSGLQYKDD